MCYRVVFVLLHMYRLVTVLCFFTRVSVCDVAHVALRRVLTICGCSYFKVLLTFSLFCAFRFAGLCTVHTYALINVLHFIETCSIATCQCYAQYIMAPTWNNPRISHVLMDFFVVSLQYITSTAGTHALHKRLIILCCDAWMWLSI